MTWSGWESFVPPMSRETGTPAKPSKRQKFGNVKKQVDGETFDSGREAERYIELKYRLAAGEIVKLECHPRFELHTLNPNGVWVSIGSFSPDFQYVVKATGEIVTEDVKAQPTRTEAYQLRKRIWEAEYGRTLVEIE